MSSLNIQVQLADGSADVAAKYVSSGTVRQCFINLLVLLKGLLGGALRGSAYMSYSGSGPVAATGSIAITHANLDADDTVTILGVTLTCKASGATGDQFNKGADATADAVNLAALINSQATLSKYLSASAASGTVTLTALHRGSIGNLLKAMTTSDATAFGLTQLSGGTGGQESAAIVLGR